MERGKKGGINTQCSLAPGRGVFFFDGNYSDYEANKAQRLGIEEPKRARYRKLMEE